MKPKMIWEEKFVGSDQLLDALYENGEEKNFIQLCEEKLNVEIKWNPKECAYEIIE